mmetsp:Transcript_52524/g.139645  ORF Transcript_52524/g.139645 Transcript_52524/m.139645 type:complete len:294 (+) Transcript_52524:519-1400(+)
MVCSIFMASRTTRGAPSGTAWPGSTSSRTILPGIGATTDVCAAESPPLAENFARACAATSRTATEATSPCRKMLTTVSGASSLGDSTTAVPPTLSPSTVARKASAEASRRVTRAQPQEGWSAWPREISSSDRGDAICVCSGGAGGAWRKEARYGSPAGAPSTSNGCNSSGEAPPPPQTEVPSRRKGLRAQGEFGGRVEARSPPWWATHWAATRARSLGEGGGGVSGRRAALCCSMKAVWTSPAWKAGVARTRWRKGTLVGKPTTFQSSRARWRARRAERRSGPRVMSLAIIGS